MKIIGIRPSSFTGEDKSQISGGKATAPNVSSSRTLNSTSGRTSRKWATR